MPRTGGVAHNPGMCPDWELNLRPFGSKAGPKATEPHQPGHVDFLMAYHMVWVNVSHALEKKYIL